MINTQRTLRVFAAIFAITLVMSLTASVEVRAEEFEEVAPIKIYDEKNLIEIDIGSVGKYHDKVCVCLTAAFRATQLAISELWGDDIPDRSEFLIISSTPTDGARDAIEFVTRAESRGDYIVNLPEGTDIMHLSEENFAFTFVKKSTKEAVEVKVKEGVFPDGFFELRTKKKTGAISPSEKKEFKAKWNEARSSFLSSSLDELFEKRKFTMMEELPVQHAYRELLPLYSELEAEHEELKTAYELAETENKGLETSYEELETEYELASGQLSTTTALMYVFIVTTIIFIVATVYFRATRYGRTYS